MDVPADLYAKWQQQHMAAERQRAMAEQRTAKRLEEARKRVRAALRALADAAKIQEGDVR